MRKVDPQSRGVEIGVRPATPEDFAFIDALHKAEADKVGFMPAQAIRKRIEEGNILVAEATEMSKGRMANVEQERPAEGDSTFVHSGFDIAAEAVRGEGPRGAGAEGPSGGTQGTADPQHSAPRPLDPSTPTPVGYCMGVDRYQKRSELGIIYHMAVLPAYRRMNVAAALLQAQFEKSAYGCRLYCCWCRQSLEANRFWEAMGFVPLAFRAAGRTTVQKIEKKTGSTKGAVHIFWQKPVRAADVAQAREGNFRGWWYPYETNGGAMMESRVVLPLPPEVQWDEATPVVLPGAERRAAETRLLEEKLDEVAQLEKEAKKAGRRGSRKNAKGPRGGAGAKGNGVSRLGRAPRAVVGYGFGAGSGFGQPPEAPEPPEVVKPSDAAVAAECAAREAALLRIQEEKDAAKQALKQAQRKSDPELVAFARDLRDRWQECVWRSSRGC
ncbi:GNAT family N-acetyltransferase [Phycisphaeraceae bacterium D3-23]